MATTRAPAWVASHGQISGVGLAHARTTAPSAIADTHSGSIVPGLSEMFDLDVDEDEAERLFAAAAARAQPT